MNRLEKKCLIAATGFHLFLLLILFIGPAFLSASKTDNLATIDFIPAATVDAAVSGGGNPRATPPPAPEPPAPTPPQPVVAPPPPPQPPQRVEPPDPPPTNQRDPDAVEPRRDQRRRIEVSTKVVTRNSNEIKVANDAARAKAAADAKRRAAEVSQVVSGLKGSLSPSTSVELQGPGGGGVPYANWLQAVKSRYSNAWEVPAGVTDDSATATVTVTIGRDGTVLSARIRNASGNALVDRSVQSVIDRIKFAAPLPEGAKEDQRTVTITFDVKAKLIG